MLRKLLFLLLAWLSLASAASAAPIRVTGRVLAERTALAGARVELFPAYESYAEAVRQLTEKTGPVPIAKALTGEATALWLAPSRPGWVEARDADGQLVPGALARWNGQPVGITGPDGRLEIAVPGQALVLSLENGEGRGAQVFRTVEEDVQPIRLEPLRRITGRVVDALSRKPVAGAVVWSGPPLAAPAVRSGEDGTFVLTVPVARATLGLRLNAGAPGFLPDEGQTFRSPEPG